MGWAAGSAYSTTTDLARFLDAALSGGLYDSALVDAQTTKNAWGEYDDGQNIESFYGLGVMLVDVAGIETQGHLGRLDGFATMAVRDAATGAVAVISTNSAEDPTPVVLAAINVLRIASAP